DGAIECALAVLEVEEHAHAGLDELLQRVGCLDLLAAEPRLLRHDEDLERWPRLQGVHESDEARTFDELGAGDPVVDVDVLVGDGPALPRRVHARMLELTLDRVTLVAGAGLVGALARVDRGDHARLLSRSTRLRSCTIRGWILMT